MKLICKLKNLMEKEGISQLALSQATGLAPGTVGKLYRNQVNRIDERTIKEICKYFRLKSVSDLFEIEWEEAD
ncbi:MULTISPECIES: helix-turn-helix domain-containing protein [unclassified Nostoc]|jgi:putative transcriptional regulator|uniref:Helix-turn-helix transcriptional regulator n=2 Tax=Nostoc TaxID=1177 RepID=A0A7D7LDA5_9NOSO|nr:helix-turn-helix transcriptional regulator [Nostoc sp. DedSLP03]MDZ7966387.1 helix-turn-helix transcriptional regulator [Nostoc sp. DedSLP03]QMS86147.1 helix-turn-helix transcriptional regulator [Nostoc edaphicum CCNP1411]